ncbi:MAG: hypothetical protein GY810_04260 [Aureispira sp.]|nr:hypothetical protein [Aureispira sp.]
MAEQNYIDEQTNKLELARAKLAKDLSSQEELLWATKVIKIIPPSQLKQPALYLGLLLCAFGFNYILLGILFTVALIMSLGTNDTETETTLWTGFSKERLFIKWLGKETKIIPLGDIEGIELDGEYGVTKGDIKIITKIKKLNTDSYRLKTTRKVYLLEGLLEAQEACDIMTTAYEEYKRANPMNNLEIE